MPDALNFLTSSEQINANYDRYKDMFKDANAELVNSETFLNLLVAEMTNQDPLEPTKNSEFVSQMAQFTQLSYAQESSKYAQANYAASLVGKTVTATKMDGAEQVVKTDVVEKVVKNGDEYSVIVGGVTFSLSNISSVVSSSDASTPSTGISTGNALGDTIARASMMIGMNATVSAKTETGTALDSGVIDSIQVKNGEVSVVINGIAYKLTDVIEVKYPEVAAPENGGAADTKPDTDSTEAVAEADNTISDAELNARVDEMLEQMMQDIIDNAEENPTEDELLADEIIDDDVIDIVDTEDVTDIEETEDILDITDTEEDIL